MAKKKKESFESLLEQTEKIVEELEGGELSLDDSLKCYTKGVENLRSCGKLIEQAEQKVKVLVEKSDAMVFEDLPDFAEDEED